MPEPCECHSSTVPHPLSPDLESDGRLPIAAAFPERLERLRQLAGLFTMTGTKAPDPIRKAAGSAEADRRRSCRRGGLQSPDRIRRYRHA